MQNEITLITRESKMLLKKADSIVVRHNDEETYMECRKEIKVDGYTTTVSEKIYCGNRITNYDGSTVNKINWVLSHTKNDLVWYTIVSNLKTNDTIYIEFIIGNTNNKMKEFGLVEDIINIIIKREGKTDLKFNLDNQILMQHNIVRNFA